MATKIRLQRHGRKAKPFYFIVVADARAKRDGRFTEKLGTYNPNTNPATIELDLDKAVLWLEKGAQPTDTARNILSYKGAMLKKHLNGGVAKGAFSQEDADKKFAKWLEEKEKTISDKSNSIEKAKADSAKKQLDAEKKQNEDKLAKIKEAEEEVAKAKAEAEAEAQKAEEAVETPETPETPEETTVEEAKAE